MSNHRNLVKNGHRAFGLVLSDDEDEGGESGGSIKPDGLMPFAPQGQEHPKFKGKAYFSGIDDSKRKMTGRARENSAAEGQMPAPANRPTLSHTLANQPAIAPKRAPRPSPR